MSDMLPAGRIRRTTILAAIAVIAALAAAGAAWFATRPGARLLFEQGLAASQQDPAAAERLFQLAMQAAGGRFPDAQIALCHALARQGLWDKAVSEFATVETQSCRDDLLLAFGRDALRAEHRSTGLEALQAASQRGTPASVAALELLRAEYHESGQQDEETAVAYELTRREPDNPDHWRFLLELLETQHKMLECEEALREVLKQELPDVYRRNFEHMLIRILVVRGQVSEARRKIAELKTVEGQSFRLSVSEIDLYRIEGRWDLALAMATALSPDAKDLPVMYHVRGVVHFDLEQYEQAARDLERAIALRPYNERAHFRLSEAYRLLRRGELAAQHGKIAAEIIAKRKRIGELMRQWMLHPQDRAIVEQLAELNAELDDEKAVQHWQQRASRLKQVQSNER